MNKELINKKDIKQTPKSYAPADQYRAQTVEEHSSKSPKINDNPVIYGALFRNKYGSFALKNEYVKTTHQENQEEKNPNDTPQRKQDPRRTP